MRPGPRQRGAPVIVYALMALVSVLCCVASDAPGQESGPKQPDPALTALVDESLSYFRPISGAVVAVDGDTVTMDFGGQGVPKVGTRLQAFSEGAAFVHPVTKEPLGRIEVPIGIVSVRASTPQETRGVIVKGKPQDFVRATVKLPGTKVRVLFSQGNTEWHLGDAYYQALKDSGRFELLDTGQESAGIETLLAEAREKGAELLLLLNAQQSPDQVTLRQVMVWSDDGTQVSEKTVAIDSAYIKELKLRATRFAVGGGDPLLSFSLPFSARRLAAGDIDGNGSTEIVLVSGKQLGVYQVAVDLSLLWEIKASFLDSLIWIQAADIDNDRKDEIIVTSFGGVSASQFDDRAPVSVSAPAGGTTVTSSVFALRGAELVRIAVGDDLFLRAGSRGLIGQRHSRANGYEGDVFAVTLAGGILETGAPLKLPQGVNIYDFEHVTSPDGRQGIVVWDDNGYLNLYDERGIRKWASRDSYGGFPLTFKRESPTVMVERGTWSVKDRLVVHLGELLAPKRIPLAGMVKGIGYKNSELRGLWWNGASLDERMFIGPISGEMLDFAVAGERIAVLTKPLFGIKTENILKGQNPFGVSLYLYSGK